MKVIRGFTIFGFLLSLLFVGSVFAVSSPLDMLQSVSNDMLAELQKERSHLKKDPSIVYRLVNRHLLPHVDITGMSRSVLGRTAWNGTNVVQQARFSRAFTDIVIHTYSSALNAYTNETIKFYPIRGGYQGKNRVTVYSKIIRQDGPPVPVNYRLALMKEGWKVYDLNVEGVSLLQSFRSQFASELAQGKTVPQLTEMLKKRHQR